MGNPLHSLANKGKISRPLGNKSTIDRQVAAPSKSVLPFLFFFICCTTFFPNSGSIHSKGGFWAVGSQRTRRRRKMLPMCLFHKDSLRLTHCFHFHTWLHLLRLPQKAHRTIFNPINRYVNLWCSYPLTNELLTSEWPTYIRGLLLNTTLSRHR